MLITWYLWHARGKPSRRAAGQEYAPLWVCARMVATVPRPSGVSNSVMGLAPPRAGSGLLSHQFSHRPASNEGSVCPDSLSISSSCARSVATVFVIFVVTKRTFPPLGRNLLAGIELVAVAALNPTMLSEFFT